MTDTIRSLLAEAHELDDAARERRKAAGRLLAALRDATPIMRWQGELSALGIDSRTADMLIRMACGTEAA